MDETFFFIILVIIALFFITAAPFLLYKGLARIAFPVPILLTLVASVVVFVVVAGVLVLGIIPGGDVLAGTLVMAVFMFVLITLGVISPFPLFERKIRINHPMAVFPLLSLAGAFFLFMASLGEAREGGPLNLFALLLPMTGWFFDGVTAMLNLGDVVYSPRLPVHTIILAAGVYLEVFITASLVYFVLSLLPAGRK